MGVLRRVDPQVAEIKRMRTSPAHQGKGYGGQLLGRLERRAVQLGHQRLCLDTTDKQDAARHLCETAGYRETRREPRPGVDENIIYEKRIDTGL